MLVVVIFSRAYAPIHYVKYSTTTIRNFSYSRDNGKGWKNGKDKVNELSLEEGAR